MLDELDTTAADSKTAFLLRASEGIRGLDQIGLGDKKDFLTVTKYQYLDPLAEAKTDAALDVLEALDAPAIDLDDPIVALESGTFRGAFRQDVPDDGRRIRPAFS